MVSSRHKFIFVHVPKTGGNSIQTILEPYSDDHNELRRHRDGIDRFNIKVLTPWKHATLSGIQKSPRRSGGLSHRRMLPSSGRPPSVVVFFAASVVSAAKQGLDQGREYWDRDKFVEDLPEPVSNFFTLDGVFRAPDVLVRMGFFGADFAAMLDRLGLPVQATAKRLNASRPPAEEYEKGER